MSALLARYRQATAASAALAARAREVLAGGATHDARILAPYGVYIARAHGAWKWDADGRAYADFTGGHGALILGHNHPRVLASVRAAIEDGMHFGANHEREIRWADLVRKLYPAVRSIRFTASGTEAYLLATRLARAFTGRDAIVCLEGHFNGWVEAPGAGLAARTYFAPQNDLGALERALADKPAALVFEPTGAWFGKAPLSPDFIATAREMTQAAGALLIFDEVISGFRAPPNAADPQPDLRLFGKILGGGMPAGAVGGREDVLSLLDPMRAGAAKVPHQGTANAHPISAACGIATLEVISETRACAEASKAAALLQAGLNAAFKAEGVSWAAYGAHSALHLFLGPTENAFHAPSLPVSTLLARDPALIGNLRLALLLGGVDINAWPGGLTSMAHDTPCIEHTVNAFAKAIQILRDEALLNA